MESDRYDRHCEGRLQGATERRGESEELGQCLASLTELEKSGKESGKSMHFGH